MPKGTGARVIATRACKVCGTKITGVPATMANHVRNEHKKLQRGRPQGDSIDSLLIEPSRFLTAIQARLDIENDQIALAKETITLCTQRILQLENVQEALKLELVVQEGTVYRKDAA